MTGNQLFELTMGLMRKIVDDGSINEATTKKFKSQTPYILTILQAELLTSEMSDKEPAIIESLDDNLLITDRTAMMIAPYGLAAHLLLEQNPEKASFFNSRYEELRRKIPKSAVPIVSVYD